MPKKRKKPSDKSINNLCKGKHDPKYGYIATEIAEEQRKRKVFKRNGKICCDNWTSMQERYNVYNPSPATQTKLDEFHTQVVLALGRIDQAHGSKTSEVRTSKETIMLLQFVLNFAHDERCNLTTACEKAANIFRWDNKSVFFIVKHYLRGNNTVPVLQAKKARGRASELFK